MEQDILLETSGHWECRVHQNVPTLIGGCALCSFKDNCDLHFVPEQKEVK